MNARRALPIRKKAWLVFSIVLFSLSWLLWVPVQSKPLLYFWQLWPMFFTEQVARTQIALWLVGSIAVFSAAAAFLSWILQFLWGLGAFLLGWHRLNSKTPKWPIFQLPAKAGFAFQFAFVHHSPGLPDPGR
jgi:hypothetical protein